MFVLAFAVGAFLLFHTEDWASIGFLGPERMSSGTEVLAFVAVMLAGLLFDLLFIALTRRILILCGELDTFAKIGGSLLANLVVAFGLVFVPLIPIYRSPDGLTLISLVFPGTVVEKIGTTVAMTNVVDALAALLFFALSSLMLLHRLLWPMVNRPLYATARLGIVRRKKLCILAGFALLAYGGVNVPEVVKAVVR